jgi:hypothetical protein
MAALRHAETRLTAPIHRPRLLVSFPCCSPSLSFSPPLTLTGNVNPKGSEATGGSEPSIRSWKMYLGPQLCSALTQAKLGRLFNSSSLPFSPPRTLNQYLHCLHLAPHPQQSIASARPLQASSAQRTSPRKAKRGRALRDGYCGGRTWAHRRIGTSSGSLVVLLQQIVREELNGCGLPQGCRHTSPISCSGDISHKINKIIGGSKTIW